MYYVYSSVNIRQFLKICYNCCQKVALITFCKKFDVTSHRNKAHASEYPNMRFFRNPNVTIALFAVYTAVMYIIFMPRNTEMSVAEKWVTGGVSVAVLALLWVLLRKREKLRREREREMNEKKEERRR